MRVFSNIARLVHNVIKPAQKSSFNTQNPFCALGDERCNFKLCHVRGVLQRDNVSACEGLAGEEVSEVARLDVELFHGVEGVAV